MSKAQQQAKKLMGDAGEPTWIGFVVQAKAPGKKAFRNVSAPLGVRAAAENFLAMYKKHYPNDRVHIVERVVKPKVKAAKKKPKKPARVASHGSSDPRSERVAREAEDLLNSAFFGE
jgi:hypothetical protein